MKETINNQKNFLLNAKSEIPITKNKELFPNIHLVKNINKTRNDNNSRNIYYKINIEPKKKDKVFSETNFKSYNGLKNHKLNKIFTIKKKGIHISQSEKKLNEKKNNLVSISSNDNKEFLNSIYSNNEKITSKFNKDLNDMEKNVDNKSNLDNYSSHNEIINDILDKTEKFFDNLGLFLEERNKKYFHNLDDKKNFEKIKLRSLDDNININKKIFNNKSYNKNNINRGDIKDINIINNYNDKTISLKINNLLNKNNNNKNNSYYKIKSYLENNNNNKKSVADEIIQTFNILDNNEQNNKSEFKQSNNDYEKNSNFLPLLSKSTEELEPNKKELKIAEVKKVYPVYPFNRIVNLMPLNNNKFNFNVHRKILIDMKEIFRHDDRYNYQQLMNNIKYINNIKKENNVTNNYRLRSSSSNNNKNISKNLEKIIKISLN